MATPNYSPFFDPGTIPQNPDLALPAAPEPVVAPVVPPKPPPLAGWANTLNKIPGLQTFGNALASNNMLIPKIAALGGGALQFKDPGMHMMSGLGDMLAAKDLAGTPKPTVAPVAPVNPNPQPVIAPKTLAVPDATPAPPRALSAVPPLGGGSPLPSPSQNFSSGDQDISGTAPQPTPPATAAPVSAGPTLAPTLQPTLPSVGSAPMNPMVADLTRQIAESLSRSPDTSGPQIDPWTAAAVSGMKPGFNPHTGNSAGQEYINMMEKAKIDQSTRSDAHAKNLLAMYKDIGIPEKTQAEILHLGAQTSEANAKAKQTILSLGLDPNSEDSKKYIANITAMETAKFLGEGQGKDQAMIKAIENLKNDPILKAMPVPSEIKAMGLNMADIAAMARTGDATIMSSIVSGMARKVAAGIAAGGQVVAAQKGADALKLGVYRSLQSEASLELARITSKFYDPTGLDPVKDQLAILMQTKLGKTAMPPDVKARYDAAVGNLTVGTTGLKGLVGVDTSAPAPAASTSAPATPARRRGRGAPAPSSSETLPPAIVSKLKKGVDTELTDGSHWTLDDSGKAKRLK